MSRSLHFFAAPSLVSLVSVVLLLSSAVTAPSPIQAQENAQSFERTLQKPFRASLSGDSLRGMLDAIHDATKVPYWLDRRVDPDQQVDPVAAGGSVEQAYEEVARAAELTAFPVDGLVVIGRVAWVDRVSAAWLSQRNERSPSRMPTIAVDWPPLTTPEDALKRVGFDAAAIELPHDLWAAFQVDAIQPSTLLLLIGAQFDRWLEPDEPDGLRAQPLPENVSLVRRYPNNARTKALHAAALQRDPATAWKVESQQIVVEAHVRVHRLIVETLRHENAQSRRDHRTQQRPSTKHATFRFELKNAPAGAALGTLAQSAGWKLEIASRAEAACRQRISFEGGPDATLEQWVERIAAKVNLTAARDGDTLRIDTK